MFRPIAHSKVLIKLHSLQDDILTAYFFTSRLIFSTKMIMSYIVLGTKLTQSFYFSYVLFHAYIIFYLNIFAVQEIMQLFFLFEDCELLIFGAFVIETGEVLLVDGFVLL